MCLWCVPGTFFILNYNPINVTNKAYKGHSRIAFFPHYFHVNKWKPRPMSKLSKIWTIYKEL